MDFYEILMKRRSCRSFSEKEISRQDIEKCVEAARLAPSACNSQPWKFIIIQEEKRKAELVQAAASGVYTDKIGPNRLLQQAPVIIALINQKMKLTARGAALIKGTDYALLDMGIAGEHFVLQATELGLGTCWVGWFNEKKVKKLLHVPKSLRIPCLLAMGYPKEDKIKEKKRKELRDIMSYDEY